MFLLMIDVQKRKVSVGFFGSRKIVIVVQTLYMNGTKFQGSAISNFETANFQKKSVFLKVSIQAILKPIFLNFISCRTGCRPI